MMQRQLCIAAGAIFFCLNATRTPAQGGVEVPAEAPAKVPGWVRHDTSLVTDARAPGLRFSKNVVLVKFKLETPQQVRSATVSRIAGTVIGGNRFNVGGIYVIQLPADSSNDRVFAALRVLNSDAGVSAADLYSFMHGKPDLTMVPPFAPDKVPSWVSADSSLVTDARMLPGLLFSKNVVTVTFKPGTSQQERAAAVSRVVGTVIGGGRLNDLDGIYVIQLPSDSTNKRVFDAIRVLKTDSAVLWAWFYWFMVGAATSKPIVPAFAPDTVPAGWLDDANLTSDARSLSRFVRDVVTVLFRPGTSQQDRTEAIASVSGEVTGGMRMDGVDGLYYVRLPADTTNNRVFDAVRRLQRHPVVRGASLKFVYSSTEHALTSPGVRVKPAPAPAPRHSRS